MNQSIDSGLVGRGTARVEDGQGIPTQSHISPSLLVNEDEVEHVSGPFFFDWEASHMSEFRVRREASGDQVEPGDKVESGRTPRQARTSGS